MANNLSRPRYSALNLFRMRTNDDRAYDEKTIPCSQQSQKQVGVELQMPLTKDASAKHPHDLDSCAAHTLLLVSKSSNAGANIAPEIEDML